MARPNSPIDPNALAALKVASGFDDFSSAAMFVCALLGHWPGVIIATSVSAAAVIFARAARVRARDVIDSMWLREAGWMPRGVCVYRDWLGQPETRILGTGSYAYQEVRVATAGAPDKWVNVLGLTDAVVAADVSKVASGAPKYLRLAPPNQRVDFDMKLYDPKGQYGDLLRPLVVGGRCVKSWSTKGPVVPLAADFLDGNWMLQDNQYRIRDYTGNYIPIRVDLRDTYIQPAHASELQYNCLLLQPGGGSTTIRVPVSAETGDQKL